MWNKRCDIKKIIFISCIILVPSLCFGEQKNIFFLHTYPSTFPWTKKLNSGIEDVLSARQNWVLYSEYLDSPRLGDALSDKEWCTYISGKYKSVKFDMVLSESSQASRFINRYGRELFGDVPKVLFASEKLRHKANTCYLKSQQDKAVVDTFNMALGQNSARQKIIAIYNHKGFFTRELADLLKLSKEKGVDVAVFSAFTFEELKEKLRQLNGDEIIFYFPFFKDSTGAHFVPRKVLAEICKIAPCPVYTFWSSLIGNGSAGGSTVDSRKIALEMFRAVDDFFQNGNFKSDYTTNQSFVDWNKVKQFDLQVSDSPDIIFVNKKSSIFSLYLKEMLIGSSIVLFLFLFVTLCGLYRILKARKELQFLNIKLKEAHMRADDLAHHDPLTGLFNRRALMKIIDHEINRNYRNGHPMSLVIIDIDHFKLINDRFGHEIGDKILQSFSDILNSSVRKIDKVARWGGEEFMILNPDTVLDGAVFLGEKIRETIQQSVFPGSVEVTISCGIGQYRTGESFNDFYKRIDAALYEAKEGGRNRVCAAE